MKRSSRRIRFGRWAAVASCGILFQAQGCFLGDDFAGQAALLTVDAVLDTLVFNRQVNTVVENRPVQGPSDVVLIENIRTRPTTGIRPFGPTTGIRPFGFEF